MSDESLIEYGTRRYIITITVIFCALLEIVDTSIVNVGLRDMAGNLDASTQEITWVISAYAIANVIVVPMSTWLSMKFGRRNYFAVSIAIFTIASFMCGQATNLWELVGFRFIQGAGGGALLATSQTILTETYPANERAKATAIYGLGVIVGPTLGPPLGGWIIDHSSWPYIFYVNIPIGIIATILTLQFIKSPKFASFDKNAKVDWAGIGLLALGVGALQFVLEKGQEADWFSAQYIVVFSILSFFGLFFFIWRELVAKSPVVELRVLKNPTLAIGTALSFILGFGLYGSTLIIPLFVQSILGFSATQAGMIFIPSSLATAFMMPLIGFMLQKKVSPKLLMAFGFAVFFIFCFWVYSTLTPQTGQGDFFWPLMIRGFGLGFLFIPVTNLALSTLKGKEIGQGASFTAMMRQLGGSFGTAIITTYLLRRQSNVRSSIVEHLNANDPNVQSRLAGLKNMFMSKGFASNVAQNQAYQLLDFQVSQQATIISYMQVFIALGLFFLLCVPVVLMIKDGKQKIDPALAAH